MKDLFERLQPLYPHSAVNARFDPFGIAVFSKRPLDTPQFRNPKVGTPYFTATVRLQDNRAVSLGVVHPFPPLTAEDYGNREFQISEAARSLLRGNPRILMGDFNATPWSASLRKLEYKGWRRASSLLPTQSLLGGLPLDHVLVSHDWSQVNTSVGPALGSDHRPVTAKLAVPPVPQP
ncbi:endonuclease/exonuclease/phosphatase family protein [Nostoc sp. CHAB 5834]|nr:endonuclease/exonuclease/phosphatase family protein [Nostoc sp. CHAB 5834]